MTQLEQLKKRFYGEGSINVKNFNFSLGSGPNITVEDVAGEINRALDQLEAGTTSEATLD